MIIVHLFKDTSLCCLLTVIFLSVEKKRNARYVLRDIPLAGFAFVFFPGVREIFGISWGYSCPVYSNEQNARLFGRGRYFALNYKLSRQNCWVKWTCTIAQKKVIIIVKDTLILYFYEKYLFREFTNFFVQLWFV